MGDAKTRLVLYSAGSGSREVLLAVRELNAAAPTYDVVAFVDEDEGKIGTSIDGIPVVGPDHQHGSGTSGACGAMDPRVRRRFFALMTARGVTPATIVHPSVTLPPGFRTGPGAILMPGVRVSFDVQLGAGVLVLWNVLLGHDLRVGDFGTILSGATIAGGCSIGEDATIGAGATLNRGARVGAGATVGVGTTVLTHVPDHKSLVALPRMLLR